jgi:hypothetical protein
MNVFKYGVLRYGTMYFHIVEELLSLFSMQKNKMNMGTKTFLIKWGGGQEMEFWKGRQGEDRHRLREQRPLQGPTHCKGSGLGLIEAVSWRFPRRKSPRLSQDVYCPSRDMNRTPEQYTPALSGGSDGDCQSLKRLALYNRFPLASIQL